MPATFSGAAIMVADIDRSTAFYTELLDLEVLYRFDFETLTEVIVGTPGGASFLLAHHMDRDTPIDVTDGLEKLMFLTDDVHALYERIIATGAESIRPPARSTHGVAVVIAFVRDPDGYPLELIELVESA